MNNMHPTDHQPLDPSHGSTTARISTEHSAGTGKRLAIIAAIASALLLIGFVIALVVRGHDERLAADRAASTSDSKETVDVVTVQPATGSYPLNLPGQTAGWDESPIFARVDGYVASWTADIGDQVKQGEVLATIDTPELDQQLNAARAKAAASDAQIQVAQSNASIAKLTYERWRDSPKGVVSEQEREEKKATFDSANAHLAEAKAQAQLDQADVGRYTAMEAFKKLTAPYDGVITARHLDIGDLVTAGSSANATPLYSMAQYKTIRVFVDVPQKASTSTAVGLSAFATSDQFPGRKFEGRITRTQMSIDPQTRTQRTEVDIKNDDLALVPGMYLQVSFELQQRGLVEVPAAAILFRPAGLEVAVVQADNKIDFRAVTIGKDNGDMIELSSGVKPGERVAININSNIAAGQEVSVVNDSESPPSNTAPVGTTALRQP